MATHQLILQELTQMRELSWKREGHFNMNRKVFFRLTPLRTTIESEARHIAADSQDLAIVKIPRKTRAMPPIRQAVSSSPSITPAVQVLNASVSPIAIG